MIVYTGIDSGVADDGEDRDRTAITLPGQQGQLIAQVAAVNPNTIGVMETIGPLDVTSFEPTTPAILWSSYNGQRKGEALADVLLGTYNPSGRTSGDLVPERTTRSRRSRATRSGPSGPTGRTYMYFNGAGLLPVRVRPELQHVRVLEPADRRTTTPTADDTINVERRRHEHGRASTATRSSSCT